MDFGGHSVYPNTFTIIRPYLGTCINPCRFYGGEIGISEHSSVQSTVSKLPVISAEAPLQTRVLHHPHTSLCGNPGGEFCCGQPYIPFSANVSGETPFRLVDEIYLIFTFSSNDDVNVEGPHVTVKLLLLIYGCLDGRALKVGKTISSSARYQAFYSSLRKVNEHSIANCLSIVSSALVVQVVQ